MTHWLGQNGEDRIVHELLGEARIAAGGRVLDIGAHDGWSLSNTARLLERGWGGTLVEASPGPLAKLIDRWGERADITIVGACVTPSDSRGMTRWSDCSGDPSAPLGDFYSTDQPQNVAKWGGVVRFRRVTLPTVTLTDVLDAGALWRADVVSVDTEGNSTDIFCALPLGALGVRVAVCEHDDRIPEIAAHCEKHGMRVAHVNAENVIAVRA